ncbi:MAG: ChaN family lipoprotein, partial [Gammaproteobacteria bacterium]
PEHALIKSHHYLNPGLSPVSTGILLLVIVAVAVIFFSRDLPAASRIQQAEDTREMDPPVVTLKKTSPLTQIVEQLANSRVVFVGETHTRYDHHLVQLEILKHLYQISPKLALGVEWFQQPFQKHLDDYIAGRITEKEMLHLTDYFNRWNYDYRLYRPIIQYAREQGIPVIALNASRELMTALSHSGFDDLSDELKQQLPADYDWSDKKYEQYLRDMFELHPEYPGEFEDFLRGQLTWDESMAERAAEYLQNNPDQRMLIFAGSGHIMFGSGIPNRLQRRMDAEHSSVLVSEDLLPVSADIADYLVISAQQELEPVGLIGAFLESQGKLVVIKDFSYNSAAEDAGLKKGAVIIGIDEQTIENFADFKLILMEKRAGDTIELHYLDSAEEGGKDVKTVRIELR